MILRSALLLLLVTAAPLAAQRRFTVTRDLVIDGEAHDLLPIDRLRVADDGTIAALSFQDMAVRFFTADGKEVGRFGRRGEGPSEFEQPGSMGWRGRTFWVADYALARLTWLGPSATLDRIERLPLELRAPTGHADQRRIAGTPMVLAIRPDGTRMVLYESTASLATLPAWLPVPPAQFGGTFVHADSAMRFRRILASFPLRTAAEPGCEDRAMYAWFCRHEVSHFHSGYAIVTIRRAPGESDARFHLLAIDAATGDTTVNRLVSYNAVPIAAATKDSIGAARQRERPGAPAYRFPASYPPVHLVLTGRDGSLWLRTWAPGGAAREWRVFDRRGIETGTVTLPVGVTPHEVRLDTVWGTQRDGNDVESIVRFRVR